MADAFIKFDQQKIAEASAELGQLHTRFTQACANIKKKSEQVLNVWRGAGAELYRTKAEELNKSAGEIAESLSSRVTELEKVAGIYSEKAAEVKSTVEGLPTDGVIIV
jgi:WXG100 family type VII secretion target